MGDGGTTIRFFLNSTFADFQVERNVLQRRVFPALRRLCAASGFRLQPIDLWWGVSEAGGTDQQTLRICFDELERCRWFSPDFFQLIQLGERYGSYILPPQVPATIVARLLPRPTTEEQDVFDAVYRLDKNAVPPEYVLLRAARPGYAKIAGMLPTGGHQARHDGQVPVGSVPGHGHRYEGEPSRACNPRGARAAGLAEPAWTQAALEIARPGLVSTMELFRRH
jgi:hypothetical protein